MPVCVTFLLRISFGDQPCATSQLGHHLSKPFFQPNAEVNAANCSRLNNCLVLLSVSQILASVLVHNHRSFLGETSPYTQTETRKGQATLNWLVAGLICKETLHIRLVLGKNLSIYLEAKQSSVTQSPDGPNNILLSRLGLRSGSHCRDSGQKEEGWGASNCSGQPVVMSSWWPPPTWWHGKPVHSTLCTKSKWLSPTYKSLLMFPERYSFLDALELWRKRGNLTLQHISGYCYFRVV